MASNQDQVPTSSGGSIGSGHKSFSLLNYISELRDIIIFTGSVLYILGYVVWSVYAWQNDLGLLPALQPQYLLAGLLPGIVVFASFQLFMAILRKRSEFGHSFELWYSSHPKSLPVILALAILLLVCVAVAFLPDRAMSLMALSVLSLLSYSFILSLLYTFLSAIMGRFESITFALFPTLLLNAMHFAASLILLYVYIVYLCPNVPQEVGGVQPHCAYLDVDRRELSGETIKDLGSDDGADSGPIVRSMKVDVLFSGPTILLFRPVNASRAISHELGRNVVLAIDWCID